MKFPLFDEGENRTQKALATCYQWAKNQLTITCYEYRPIPMNDYFVPATFEKFINWRINQTWSIRACRSREANWRHVGEIAAELYLHAKGKS